jgi:hypothetical protein
MGFENTSHQVLDPFIIGNKGPIFQFDVCFYFTVTAILEEVL